MSLEEVIGRKFAVTAEVGPPKGADITKVLEKARMLAKCSDAINVTDNQRAVVKLSSIALCKILLDNGIEPILQTTCRDRNRIALQSDLLGASALGIRNVLVISGDHPINGDHPTAKPVYDVDSVQLLDIISGLNDGLDYTGNKLNQATSLFAGAAINPGADNARVEVLRVKKKLAAGAGFFQSQVVYDAGAFKDFMKKIDGLGARVLAGIIPLKSAGMARFMNENIPGVKVPKDIIERIGAADDPVAEGIILAAELIVDIKDSASGVHVMALGAEERVPGLLKKAGL